MSVFESVFIVLFSLTNTLFSVSENIFRDKSWTGCQTEFNSRLKSEEVDVSGVLSYCCVASTELTTSGQIDLTGEGKAKRKKHKIHWGCLLCVFCSWLTWLSALVWGQNKKNKTGKKKKAYITNIYQVLFEKRNELVEVTLFKNNVILCWT